MTEKEKIEKDFLERIEAIKETHKEQIERDGINISAHYTIGSVDGKWAIRTHPKRLPKNILIDLEDARRNAMKSTD